MKKRIGLTVIILIAAIAVIAYFVNARSDAAMRDFALSELGVLITIPGSLADLSYSPRTQQGINTVLHMQIENECEIGVFYAVQKNAIAASRTSWTEEMLEAASQPNGDIPAQVKEFTDFYLVFEPSQATCGDNESKIQYESEKRRDLWHSVTTARYIS